MTHLRHHHIGVTIPHSRRKRERRGRVREPLGFGGPYAQDVNKCVDGRIDVRNGDAEMTERTASEEPGFHGLSWRDAGPSSRRPENLDARAEPVAEIIADGLFFAGFFKAQRRPGAFSSRWARLIRAPET